MTRFFVAVLMVFTFTACGGGAKGSTTPVPHLTWNGTTTTVDAGKEAEVSIPSNTSFTIEAIGVVSWNFSWFPSENFAHAYPTDVGGETYTAEIATSEPVQYIVSATFSENRIATLKINVTSGGICDASVTCSNHGACGLNAADFPVCTCDLPYRVVGFQCVDPRSCMLPNETCIDFSGEYWLDPTYEMLICNNMSGTYSSKPCAKPTGLTLIGYCTIQIFDLAPTSQILLYYYSWDATAAKNDCEADGTWTQVQ